MRPTRRALATLCVLALILTSILGASFQGEDDASSTHHRSAPSPLAHAITRVRKLRTRREFADELGVTEQTIYNWETSRSRPTRLDHYVALLHAGVPRHLLHPGLPPDDHGVEEWRKQDLQS